MRSRLLALAILMIIIGIPAGIYWYFFSRNTASLIISVNSGSSFTVQLEGIIDNASFPLIDRLIQIERQCITICTISPIAPLRYILRINSPGKSPIETQINIGVNEDKVLTLDLLNEILFEPITYITQGHPDISKAIMSNIVDNGGDIRYTLVGVDNIERVYAIRDTFGRRELGILDMDRFTSVYVIPSGVGSFTFDFLGQNFIAPIGDTGTLIVSPDGAQKRELPIQGIQGYVHSIFGDKVYTKSGVLAINGDRSISNPRFTDWIDISSTMRIGYISSTDTDRLNLSNMPSGESVLVLVDRSTGKSSIIKRGINVRALFYMDNSPAMIDMNGNTWKILL